MVSHSLPLSNWPEARKPDNSQCWTVLEGEHLFKDRLPSRNGSTSAHIARMIALLGPPPKNILERGSWSKNFFDESGKFKADVGIATTSLEDEIKSLKGEEKTSFLKSLRRMLRWRPEDRRPLESWCRILGYKVYWQAAMRRKIMSLLYKAHITQLN